MAYPSLSDVRQDHKVQWYRSALDPKKFREFSTPSDLKGFVQAGGHLLLYVGAASLTYYFWSIGSWILFAVALFALGTICSFFSGTAPHELGHGTVFKTKWLNKFFLYLFSIIGWWDPFNYACSHTYHHRFTLHPEGDRENLLPLHPNVDKSFLLQLFTVNLMTRPGRTFGKGGLISTIYETILGALGKTGSTDISSNEWLNALHKDQPEEHRNSILWSRFLLLFHGSILAISLTTGLWALFIIISLPSFFANWLGYFVGLSQHCGLQENTTDFRKSVRSMRLNPFVEFLYWHMNWHTEHHMYAGVPCYNLKNLYQEIKEDMPEPRTLSGAWREMLDTWEKQKSDPDYFYDTPLPATAKLTRKRGGTLEDASVGDLAPKGLKQ